MRNFSCFRRDSIAGVVRPLGIVLMSTLLFASYSQQSFANHLFSDSSPPKPPSTQLFAGEGVDYDFSLRVSSSSTDLPIIESLEIYFIDTSSLTQWSAGDVLRVTVGGHSRTLDFSNPSGFNTTNAFSQLRETNITDASAVSAYNAALSAPSSTIRFENLAGDGFHLAGFVINVRDGTTLRQTAGAVSTFVEKFGAIAPVPEPSSIILLITGAIGLIGYGWRRKRKPAA